MKEKLNKKITSYNVGKKFFGVLELWNKQIIPSNRRTIVVFFLTWLPLLVLTILGGVAFDGVKVPFIDDINVHIRFLVVLSILIYSEIIAHERIRIIVEQFLKCHIIAEHNKSRFNHIVTSAIHLRESVIAKIILIILVYTIGHWISTKYLPLGASSWYSLSNNTAQLTPAGYWYFFVSLPIFQFFLLRWYFHVLVWYRFLWQISRLPLQLNSLHPDRSGGLGFLVNSIYALAPFLLAHSVLLSGMIFSQIWNIGATIFDFKMEIFSILFFIIMIPLIPLLFFTFQMLNEKRMGTLNYDVVANRYVNDFRQKWIKSTSINSTTLLGTSDIQSLADLFNSFEVSSKMRIIPFGRSSIMTLVFLTVLPLAPLALTIIPLEKIISQIFGIIF